MISNNLLDQLANVSVRETLDELGRMDPYIWAVTHRRLRGRPAYFDLCNTPGVPGDPPANLWLSHRPFLIQPLCDQSQHKIYKKGRQMGVSEEGITECSWFLDAHPGTKAVYTFPRDAQLKDFSVTRINEAMNETPAMARLLGGTNQVYTKRVGASYLLLRSAWESNLGEGIDADAVYLDEIDRMKPGVDAAFTECLTSSKHGLLRQISTPTLPGRGIDSFWQDSNQYMWFVKCTRCGEKQPILYPDNIIQQKDIEPGMKDLPDGAYEYRCHKESCRGSLDRLHGEWVAKYPSRTRIIGYHMPQTIAPWIDATNIMQKKITIKFEQFWVNYVLGECATGSRMLVTDDDIFKCVAPYTWTRSRSNEWSRICVGIDWGHENWCLIVGVNAYNDLPYVIGMFTCKDDDRDPLGSARQIADFIRPFGPDLILADSGYGKDRNSFLNREFAGKFYAVYYNSSDKHSRTFKPQFVPQSARVIADRTITLKNACQYVRERKLGLPQFDKWVQLLGSHLKNLAPLLLDDDGDVYEIIDKTGDDHLAHALGYALLGVDQLTEGWRNFNVSFE